MPGFVKGLSDGFESMREPFTSESIAPEAIIDILVRKGVTDTGTRLYTEATPWDDKVRIIAKHLLKTQVPFSQSQMARIYYASKGYPDPRGNVYELEDELPGLMGWRLIKIDPVKGLGFKITKYNGERRNSTREFTSDRQSRLLAGGRNTPEEIARQFFVANRALFNAQQKMHLDLKAANEFEVTDDELAEVFQRRGTPVNTFGAFFEGIFNPYTPSENIINKFFEIDEKNGTNSIEQALPIIEEMIGAFQNAPLDKRFKFKMEDFGIKEAGEEKGRGFVDPRQSNLQTPPVDPSIVQAPMNNMNVSQTGLTATEQALLSPEEQGIRLRQRGMG